MLYIWQKKVCCVFSIVTSGKALTDKDVEILAETIKEIKSKSNIFNMCFPWTAD